MLLSRSDQTMAVLYVWYPNEDSWGHASLLLEESRVYISWWPKDDKAKYGKKKKKVDAKEVLPKDYDEDVEFNGRECTHRYVIIARKINPGPIIEWWRKTKGDGGYHVLGRNCCDVVYSALQIGGCYEWVHPGIKIVSTPRHMTRYGKELENAIEKNGNPCVIR